MSTASPQPSALPASLRDFLAVPFRSQTYHSLAYLVLAFPLGLVYFVGVVVGLSLGAGLLITWVGIPIVVLTMLGATVVAGFEAKLAERLLGIESSVPEVLREADVPPSSDGFAASLKRLLLAPTTWTSLLLVIVKFGYGLVAFVALVTAGSFVSEMLSAPFLYNAPYVTYRIGAFGIDTLPAALGMFLAGTLLALVFLHVLNSLAYFGGLLTATLLSVDRQTDRTDA